MAATRPIYRDPYGTVAKPIAAVTLEQQVQLRQKPVTSIAPKNVGSNALGNGLAGYRVRGRGPLGGGGFAPRAVSGMRTAP